MNKIKTDSGQRIIPFAYLISILLPINSTLEFFFGSETFAALQVIGSLISLLLLLLLHKKRVSSDIAVAVYMLFAASTFSHAFQYDTMNSNLNFYALLCFLLFHILGLRRGLIYSLGISLFALTLCALAWNGVIVMVHSPKEMIDFFIVLFFFTACAFYIERERQQRMNALEEEYAQRLMIAQQLQQQLDDVSRLEKLDGVLLQEPDDRVLHCALTVLLESLGCSRAWLLHVRSEVGESDASVWHVPYEKTVNAYPGAFEKGGVALVDDVVSALFEQVSAAHGSVCWNHMQDIPAATDWLQRHHIRAQMMVAMHLPNRGRWYLGVHQCDRERQWQQNDQRFLQDCASRMRAVLAQKLMHDELKKTASRAEQSSHAKSEFLATMSHELRTPLHGIIGMQNMLAKNADYLTLEHRKLLGLAQHSSHVLSSLIDDVLDLSKIEAGKVKLNIGEFDLPKCLHDALLPFLMIVHEKHLDLHLKYQQIPVRIQGDETRIRQVLLNLIGNAVKFTAHGKITVSARYKSGHLYLSVSDTGIGIAADELDQLFEPFIQLSDAPERKGTGLGTTIAQRFVHLMYGHLDVRSELGIGTVFDIELPLPDVDSERCSISIRGYDLQHALPIPLQDVPKFTPTRILLAEDDPIARHIASASLVEHGLHVDVAEHGLEAWEKVQQHDYDLLLTDIRMPGLNGMELTQRIRQHEKETHCPRMLIVGLSAHVLEEVGQECLAIGMDDFISKPINPDQLMQRLYQVRQITK